MFKIVVTLLYTMLCGLIFMGLVFCFLIPVIYLIAPGIFIIFVGESSEMKRNTILLLRILLVLFYPLVGFVVATTVFLVFVTYPALRLVHGTHMYDEFDRFMHQMSAMYLRGISCLLRI